MNSLRTLGEPELPTEAQPQKSARLVIAPPFPAWRVVVTRVTLEGDAVVVTTKTLSDWYPGTGHPGAATVRRLPRARWGEIEDALRVGLWSYHPEPFPNPLMQDGSAWYLEASGPRGHIAVIQHSPPDNAFRKAGQVLLGLSGLDYSQREFVSWFAPQ